jgi:hypothetical protein
LLQESCWFGRMSCDALCMSFFFLALFVHAQGAFRGCGGLIASARAISCVVCVRDAQVLEIRRSEVCRRRKGRSLRETSRGQPKAPTTASRDKGQTDVDTGQITNLAKADVNGVVSLMRSTGIGRPLCTYWTAVSPALQSHSHSSEPICALYFTPSRHHVC